MNLLAMCQLTLSLSHAEKLNAISNWNFDSIKKLVKKEALENGKILDEAYLEKGIQSLKQYYTLAVLDPSNVHAIALPLDPFWHAHILFTEDYSNFCESVAGHYMHHVPLDTENPTSVEIVDGMYSYTLSALEKIYGYVDPLFFPEVIKKQAICSHYRAPAEFRHEGLFPEMIHLTQSFNRLAAY